MDEIVVKYNIPVEEVIQQSQTMFNQIDNLSRISNEQQIRLLQETTNNMGNIIDIYVNRVKASFDIMFDIMKSGWELSYADAKNYTDKVAELKDRLFDKLKENSNKEVELEKEKISEKLRESEREFEEIKKNTDRRISEKQREFDALGSLNMAYRQVTGNMQTAMGGYGSQNFSSLVGIGGSALGSVGNFAGLQPGEGIKDLANAVASSMGLLSNIMRENDETKRSILSLATGRGVNISDIYDDYYFSTQPGSTLTRLQETEKQFAGIREFDRNSQLGISSTLSTSRQFQTGEDYLSDAYNITLLGKGRNVDQNTITSFFIDMKMRLNESTDAITGRFGQLDKIAESLGMRLTDVMRDYQQMVVQNQKMNFSQEELMGMYKAFGEEIKKGTVTVSQLMEYMKGLQGQSTEQTISGMAMLFSMSDEDIMRNYQGQNRKGAQGVLSTLRGAFEKNPFEGAQLMRMYNNPNADYSQDPFLSQLMGQYGLSQGDLSSGNPEIEKLFQGFGFGFGQQSGNMGEGYFLQEKARNLVGLGMPNNLFDAMMQQKGISTVGVEGVPSLEAGEKNAKDIMSSTEKVLEGSVSALAKAMKDLDITLSRMQLDMEKTFKQDGPFGLTLSAANKQFQDGIKQILKDFGLLPNEKDSQNKTYGENQYAIAKTIGLSGSKESPSYLDKVMLEEKIGEKEGTRSFPFAHFIRALFDSAEDYKKKYKETYPDKNELEIKMSSETNKMMNIIHKVTKR